MCHLRCDSGLHCAVTFEHIFFFCDEDGTTTTVPQREMFNFKYEQQYNGHPIKSPQLVNNNVIKTMFTMKY